MIVQSTINVQGSAFIAGYTAVNKLYGLLECTAISIGNVFTTFASQNYGAGNYKRVRKGVNTGMILAIGAALCIMAVVLPLNRVLPQLFMDISDAGAEEALVRVVMAKVFFFTLGVEVLFYIEPLAWLAAWVFVLVPYYFYQRKRLPI